MKKQTNELNFSLGFFWRVCIYVYNCLLHINIIKQKDITIF